MLKIVTEGKGVEKIYSFLRYACVSGVSCAIIKPTIDICWMEAEAS